MNEKELQTTKTGTGTGTGYFFLILGAFLVSWQTPLAKIMQEHGVPAIGTVTMMYVAAAVLFNLMHVCTGKVREVYRPCKGHLPVLIMMGCTTFLVNIGLFFAVRTLNAAVVSVLLYLAPAFVCLFFLITGIRPVSFMNKLAILVCILGSMCALDVFHTPVSELSGQGILFGVLAGAGLAGYTILADVYVPEQISRISVVTITVNTGAVLGTLVDPGLYARFLTIGWTDILILFALAYVTKILYLQFLVRATKTIGAERASVVMSMEVPFTLMVAFFTLHQTMLPIQLAGVGLVILSVVLLRRNEETPEGKE